MLTVSRNVLRRFRAVCQRTGIRKSRRAASPVVTLLGTADGYRLQVLTRDFGIEYSAPIASPEISLRLPLEVFDACARRREELVTFNAEADGRVELLWTDRGVPRRAECVQRPPSQDSFPPMPTDFTANGVEMWSALGDAVTCTDVQSSRYALGCLNLCGVGRIEATDGRQALVQTGYSFGWEDNVLVPGSELLGCSDIEPGDTIEIGRTEEWVALRIGPWLIQLRIQKDARFPKIEQVIPNPDFARSRLELAASDAEFLRTTLPSLPCHDDVHRPITLDLNGRVLVRSREPEGAYPVEVDLRASKLEGDALTLNTDRRYVERALQLGFRQVRFHGPETPALAIDDRRQFLWAVLDKASAIPRHEQAHKIESPVIALKIPKSRRTVRTRAAA